MIYFFIPEGTFNDHGKMGSELKTTGLSFPSTLVSTGKECSQSQEVKSSGPSV